MTDYFLVRIADDPITFLSELLEGHPYGVTEPTLAAQMSYEDASDLVRYLRLKGYSDSCVLNIYGVPPSARDLARMRRMQEENVKCVVIVDNKFYFTGQQVGKHERLTADIKDALQLSRKVAEGIREKLRGTGLRNVRMEEIERRKIRRRKLKEFGEMCPRNATSRGPCKPLPRPTQNRNWSKWQSARKSHERRNTFSRGLQ